MEDGPTQLLKLPFQGCTHKIQCHPTLPYLLRVSQHCIENYNLKQEKTARQIILTEEAESISHISYSNKKITYATNNQIRVNQNKLHIHNQDIKHFIVDHEGVIISSAEDRYDRSIKIVSTYEDKSPCIQGEFNFHYDPVTALYWKNSLVISGDASGEVCLWDINKCQTVFHRKVHYEPVRFIGAYVDYSQNNIFYTVSPTQKRIIFSDLRTNKPIRILASLHSQQIISVKNTNSGKIAIVYEDLVDLVDIYKQYKMIGSFSPLVIDKMNHMKWTAKSFSFKNVRKLCNSLIMGKYVVVGCDNGCIEVYDTDTLECLYAFGLTKYGPIKSLQCNSGNDYIVGLDAQGDVYKANFTKPTED